MRYVFLSILFFGLLTFSIHLVAEENKQETQPPDYEEVDKDYNPDWDVIIQEIERDVYNRDDWSMSGISGQDQ